MKDPEEAQIFQERLRMESLIRSDDPKAQAYAESWFRRYGRDKPKTSTVNWSDR